MSQPITKFLNKILNRSNSESETLPKIPKQWIEGMEPTLNNKGYMFQSTDEFSEDFVDLSGKSDDEALELGSAYGIATIAALKAGATITACDMDEGHLKILKSRTPKKYHNRLTTVVGTLPNIELPENHFGTLLCSRVLHFLSGEDIDASLKNMYRWLKPGGKLFLVADTPWGIWRNFIPTWDKNVENGERWPGYMEPTVKFLPFPKRDITTGPPFMNLMSPQLLCRSAREAGFDVRKCIYISREDFQTKGRMDGRENCGIMAVKPDPSISYSFDD
ncbi:MAG: class I SAM-dependent methyltransferase [Pseudomonadota bacterium]|nr:class I SAM-dependent methyltransferase [Pseudomonadota bacterium]